MNTHGTRYTLTTTHIAGERTLIVSPPIPDNAPTEVREGMARRGIVNAGGTCPCGARMQLPNRTARRRAKRAGKPLHVRVEHEDHCPAATDRLRAAWGQQ